MRHTGGVGEQGMKSSKFKYTTMTCYDGQETDTNHPTSEKSLQGQFSHLTTFQVLIPQHHSNLVQQQRATLALNEPYNAILAEYIGNSTIHLM